MELQFRLSHAKYSSRGIRIPCASSQSAGTTTTTGKRGKFRRNFESSFRRRGRVQQLGRGHAHVCNRRSNWTDASRIKTGEENRKVAPLPSVSVFILCPVAEPRSPRHQTLLCLSTRTPETATRPPSQGRTSPPWRRSSTATAMEIYHLHRDSRFSRKCCNWPFSHLTCLLLHTYASFLCIFSRAAMQPQHLCQHQEHSFHFGMQGWNVKWSSLQAPQNHSPALGGAESPGFSSFSQHMLNPNQCSICISTYLSPLLLS